MTSLKYVSLAQYFNDHVHAGYHWILFQTVIHGVIVYAMMRFEWTVAKFFWYIFFLFFSLTYFTFYGMMVMAMSPNIHIYCLHHILSILCSLESLLRVSHSRACKMPTILDLSSHNIIFLLLIFFVFFFGFWWFCLRIPSRWKWYYWCSPLAWTLHGLMASQFGDLHYEMGNGLTVSEFLNVYFGYKQEFIGVVAYVMVGFTILLAFGFAVSIKLFNFQRRWEKWKSHVEFMYIYTINYYGLHPININFRPSCANFSWRLHWTHVSCSSV